MKKRIIISLLCGIVICCMAVYSFGTTGIVNVDTLRLRKSNSIESSILALLSVDDKVEILTRTEDGWYQVRYTDLVSQQEYEGYVSEEYITLQEDETIPTTNVSEENETLEEDENNDSSEEVGTEEKVEESTTKIINKGEKIYLIPLVNSNTTTILENDITVEVLTEINGWAYVSSDTIEGWIRVEKLQEVDAKKKTGYISKNSVNFRKQPNTSGTVISKLSRNTEVEILEENNGWTKIEYNDTIGYVLAEYISSTKIATTSRSSSSRRTSTTTMATTTTIATTETTTTATNPNASEIVAYAKQFLGYKYVYGGNTPAGFDCSGFTQYVYKHFGYSLSRSSASQAGNGVAVSKANLQPGDIVCFARSSGSSKVGHVGIYIGGGQFIHAANSNKGVIISNVDGAGYYYVCARRIV